MSLFKLNGKGYGWMDYVTVDGIDSVDVDEEMITFYCDGVEVANVIKGYVNEVGYREYSSDERIIVYEY